MSGIVITNNGTRPDLRIRGKTWQALRATPFIVSNIERLVLVASDATAFDADVGYTEGYIEEHFKLERSQARLSYATLPVSELPSVAVMGCRLLRMITHANGKQLCDAVATYKQRVVYESKRLTQVSMREIAKLVTSWGNDAATHAIVDAVEKLIGYVAGEFNGHSDDTSSMEIKYKLLPSLARDMNEIQTRRQLQELLIGNMATMRGHDIILTLQYLFIYAITELLDTRPMDLTRDTDSNQVTEHETAKEHPSTDANDFTLSIKSGEAVQLQRIEHDIVSGVVADPVITTGFFVSHGTEEINIETECTALDIKRRGLAPTSRAYETIPYCTIKYRLIDGVYVNKNTRGVRERNGVASLVECTTITLLRQ